MVYCMYDYLTQSEATLRKSRLNHRLTCTHKRNLLLPSPQYWIRGRAKCGENVIFYLTTKYFIVVCDIFPNALVEFSFFFNRSSESTVCDMSLSTSSNLSREESYLSLEPLYLNSISRSSSERSGAGARDVLVSPLGEATEFLPIKVIAPDMQGYIQGLLEPIFEDYHRIMVSLCSL